MTSQLEGLDVRINKLLQLIPKGHAVGGDARRPGIHTSRMNGKQRKVKYHIWRCKKCRSSDDLGRRKDAVLGKATRRTQRRTFAFASRPTHGCM